MQEYFSINLFQLLCYLIITGPFNKYYIVLERDDAQLTEFSKKSTL